MRHAIAVSLLAVAGCSTAPTPETAEATIVYLPVPTSEPYVGPLPQPCDGGLIEGRLAEHPTWGIAIINRAGIATRIIWPFGYQGALLEGRLALLDRTGRILSFVGDQVRVGGGQGRTGDWFACPGLERIGAPLNPP